MTDDDLRRHWGKPFDELTTVLYQGKGSAEARRANFTRHELEFPKEYQPHALTMIAHLRAAGLRLGLMTGMFWEGAKIDLLHLKFPLEDFAVLQGSEATPYHKPDPRVFEPALETLKQSGIENGIVYVGETLNDYYAARDAGLDFIGVTLGSVDEATFKAAGAQIVLSDLPQVEKFILSNAGT